MKNCIALLVLAGACLAQFPQFPNQQPNRNCGANEQFNSCGSACEPSCTNPNPQICTMQCVVGCQCRQGFFRNAQKQCVQRNQCPNGPGQQNCGVNEQYTQCGSACQPSCSNPNPICTQQCVAGCSCRQGYIRNAQRQCVPRQQCPNTPNSPGQIRTTRRTQQNCGVNEQYTQCGSACQPSCSNPNPICTLQCVAGCSCRQGYIRNAQRQCVPRQQCPNTQFRTTRSTATTGCATIRCSQGYQCVEPPQINCFRAPCPQLPARCEPITRTTRGTTTGNTCATTRCPQGKRCVLQQVQCIRAPCNPIPQCV